MQLARKALAVAARRLVFSLTSAVLVLNAGCGESASPQGQADRPEVTDYKNKMRELKTAKKADTLARKKR